MLFKQIFAVIPLFLSAVVDAYGAPGACSGHCFAHDPSVIQRASDKTYFLFNTGGGIGISKSTSLSGPWTYVGDALTGASKIALAGNTDLWAPDVHLIGSTYYLYYAVSTFGTQTSAIGVMTSTTMEVGSWTDLGATGIASAAGKAYNAIDPNLILAGSTYLMNFGSFWHDIYQVPMASTPSKIAGTASYNIAYNSTGTSAEEGAYMFYYSGYYYLLFSSGVCCNYNVALPPAGTEYRIVMCRSTSATGSFVDKDGKACTANGGSTLLKSHDVVFGPGGQGVFTDSTLGLVLYYHYANTNDGIADANYLFGWNQITWSSGWPVV